MIKVTLVLQVTPFSFDYYNSYFLLDNHMVAEYTKIIALRY